jgi:Transposase DDE domain
MRPSHISLCPRAPRPSADVVNAGDGSRSLHLLVDSTSLKLCGAGERLVEKHGTRTRRSWRKLHLGVDAGTGQIVAAALTNKEVDDAARVGPLLDQLRGTLSSLTADGAYDQDGVYADVAGRHPEAVVIVPPRCAAVLSN